MVRGRFPARQGIPRTARVPRLYALRGVPTSAPRRRPGRWCSMAHDQTPSKRCRAPPERQSLRFPTTTPRGGPYPTWTVARLTPARTVLAPLEGCFGIASSLPDMPTQDAAGARLVHAGGARHRNSRLAGRPSIAWIPTALSAKFPHVHPWCSGSRARRHRGGIGSSLAGAARLGGGALADDPQRRRATTVGGYTTTAVLSGLIGVATSAWQVGVLRAGAWVARGLRVPSRNALLADAVPKAKPTVAHTGSNALWTTSGQ